MPGLIIGPVPETPIDDSSVPVVQPAQTVSNLRSIGSLAITSNESLGSASLSQIIPPDEDVAVWQASPFLSASDLPTVPQVTISRAKAPLTFAEQFSTPILDQNQTPTGSFAVGTFDLVQEFVLPRDFARGITGGNGKVPALTGLQLLVDIDQGYQDVAALDYELTRHELNVGEVSLASGTAIGNDLSGDKVWFTIYFDEPIDVEEGWIDQGRFRFLIHGRSAGTAFQEEVPYQNNHIISDGYSFEAFLEPGKPFHLAPDTVFYQDEVSGKVYRSGEQGISQVYASTPNPLVTTSSKAYAGDGTTPLTISGSETSFCFRILASTAEDGTDFLGNKYRSVAVKNTVNNITTLDSSVVDQHWLSRPNPSKFAVESLYFDLSGHDDAPVTVDRILLDPITPGVYFNVYYSSEGEPGQNEIEWENKLWTRVPHTFHLQKRDTYALPQPITARYLCIEFTQLQPNWYAPGNFQKPTYYKKYPKWVLDYFLVRALASKTTEDSFIASEVQVNYNALDLAYNYYLDDIHQEPLTPVELGSSTGNELSRFLQSRSDESDKIDSDTLSRIKVEFAPYTNPIARQGTFDYLPAIYTDLAANQTLNGTQTMTPDFPTEDLAIFSTNSDKVSTIFRENVLLEKGFPVMFFFMTCRHKYRKLVSTFENDRAYFVGLQQVAFMRDRYPVAHDTPLYVDHAGDNRNSERNDLSLVDLTWQTYPEDA
jgi:hypothetical protein